MKKLSLKWQILLLVLSVVTIALGLLTALTVDQIKTQLLASLEQKAISISSVLAENVGSGLEFQDTAYIAEIVQGVFADSDVVGVGVYDNIGQLVYEQMLDERLALLKDTCSEVEETSLTHRDQLCIVERQVEFRDRRLGCIWLVVSEDALAAQVQKSVIIIVAGTCLLVTLAIFAGLFVTSRLVKPIRTLEEAVTRVAGGDMDSSVDLNMLHKDFLPLGGAFNEMQKTLIEAFEALRRSQEDLEGQVERRTEELQAELNERQKAEVALKDGQELLRATLESTADGILAVNAEGKATHTNARFAEMWRIPEALLRSGDDARLLAHVLDQLVDPDKFLEKVSQLYGSTDESLDTLHFRDKRVFERFSCPLKRDEEVVGRVWSFRDVTARIRAMEKLQFTQFSVDRAADPAFWMKKDGRFFYVNDAACRSLDYSREELLKLTIHDIDPNFPREAWDAHWQELRAKGSLTLESVHQKRNGDGFPVEIRSDYVEFEGEEFLCAFSRNITERKRTEQAQAVLLQVSDAANQVDSLEELLQLVQVHLGTVIDTTNFYVALYHADTDLYSFPYHRDKFDESEVQPISLLKGLTDYVRRTGEPLLVDDAAQNRLEASGEVKLAGAPSKIWLGVPLRTSSGALGVMAVQHYTNADEYSRSDMDWLMSIADPIARVIERKQSEEQEQDLREQLERADRMKSLGILAGGVAHDLNNMLGPLVGYPELMLMNLEEGSKLWKQANRIGKAAREAAEVVQDLLTLARRGRYEMVPTDINDIVRAYQETPGFAQLIAQRPDINVTTRLDAEVGKVMGSSAHLSKVVMNLIVNAFDAMSGKGELTISTSQRHLDSLPSGYAEVIEGEYAILMVKDTGMGIDAKDIDKIFEPYYSKKKMGSSGSGLGLSVVYGVIKDHKGYYDILSTVGEGAEFTLYLPITKAKVTHKLAPENSIGGAEKVLIVDDDPAQREIATALITSYGYETATAENGHQAVEYLKANDADLIVLDMIMENNFDGLDTYREIVKSKPNQKAIIVSGYSSTDRVAEMQRLGAGQYVKKPYTRQVIGEAIRQELHASSKTDSVPG